MSFYDARVEDIAETLSKEAYELWVEIGERLVMGQKNYGGFKFAEYDLEKMKREEIEDWIVYLFVQRKLLKG